MTETQAIYWPGVLDRIKNDPRYSEGITYGKPRIGHAEGAVKNHIEQLEQNLIRLQSLGLISGDQSWKLVVLIHIHDTFKFWAKRDSAIEDPQSHASLATKFLAELIGEADPEAVDMLWIVQYHDEGYALWKQVESKGKYNEQRFRKNVGSIRDMRLFLLFTLIDGYTPSKEPKRIRWFVDEVFKQGLINLPDAQFVYKALDAFGV